jgi:hypothetical protein
LALGWEIQLAHPEVRLRTEYRPAYLDRRAYLDLWAADADWTAAIELKCFTRALNLVDGNERFELLNHGAQDISRYDFAQDVERVESVVNAQPGVRGYALALSNDSSYWRAPPPHAPPSAPPSGRAVGARMCNATTEWKPGAGPKERTP